MKFNRNFIGNEIPNRAYTSHGIRYNFNNLGHRCKNIEDINLDNYILFAGCSHTEGVGLQVEESYPYITAKNLECDYYNLGLSASGFDVLFYNVMTWFQLYKKPKLLVMQYPDPSRFSSLEANSTMIVPHGSWKNVYKEKLGEDIYVSGTELGLFQFRNYCFTRLLSRSLDVPVIKLVFGHSPIYDSDCIRIDRLDYAADNMHYGIDTHMMCSETILEQLQ
jgi:hypothetical protein